MKLETAIAHAGLGTDPATGALSVPIYQTATFRHPALGESTGYDYSRTSNPTRKVLEDTVAALERGDRGFAFASGMAAITAVMTLFQSGDHLVFSEDLYGGTYRLLDKVFSRFGLEASFVDSSDLAALAAALRPGRTKAVFVETPSNPLMRVTDIRETAALAAAHGALTIVDNTLMTPLLQRPLELGADIVVHSGTKFIGGHNDVLCGLVVAKGEELCRQIGFVQNSTGGTLGPQDSWLVIRGLKTLAVRMERAQRNAAIIADTLAHRAEVVSVHYPDSEAHFHQASGAGAVLSFAVRDAALAASIINNVRVVSFAESLGGVESLITYPARQTHGDIPAAVRERNGITDTLLRLSVGIEDVQDLVDDLRQAMETT